MRARPKRSAIGPQMKRQSPAHQKQREQDGAGAAPTFAGEPSMPDSRQQLGERRAQHQRIDEGIHAVQSPAGPGRPEAGDLPPRSLLRGCAAVDAALDVLLMTLSSQLAIAHDDRGAGHLLIVYNFV